MKNDVYSTEIIKGIGSAREGVPMLSLALKERLILEFRGVCMGKKSTGNPQAWSNRVASECQAT